MHIFSLIGWFFNFFFNWIQIINLVFLKVKNCDRDPSISNSQHIIVSKITILKIGVKITKMNKHLLIFVINSFLIELEIATTRLGLIV